jgi:hypothetical protein
MNPTFPATPYTGPVIATIDDPVSRQHLSYDSWLFNERTRNWAAYMSHMQQKQQELRIRVLQQQYQNSMAKFYEQQLREQQLREQQRQALEAQQQQEEQRQKQQDQADMESYLKEIDEQHQQQAREAEEEAVEDDADAWYEAAEQFAKSCRAEALQERRAERRERQREVRRDRRAFARADKALGKLVQDHSEPVEDEVSRAENYNADKPSRTVRYVGADKRKAQRFQARRQFGSGWAKQQL